MSYCIDCSAFTVAKMLKRIQTTDLIPSLECIHEKANDILTKFKQNGLENLEEIRKSLSTKKKITEIAEKLQIEDEVLVLFRREIEGWISKERAIDEFDWISVGDRKKLVEYGIATSKDAFEKISDSKERKELSKCTNIQDIILEDIYCISSLLRIRWLSPMFARIFYDLDYTVGKIQKAKAAVLTKEVDEYNKKVRYYKGKIGEKDIGRVISESQYVEG